MKLRHVSQLTIITHSTPYSLVVSASIFQAAGCGPPSTHIQGTFPSAAADAETMATLVRKFDESKILRPEQQVAAALELVQFCTTEAGLKRDTAGKAGVVAALVQMLDIADTGLKTAAVAAFGSLVLDHRDNQRRAATAGAMPRLLQLMSTELGDSELQLAVVTAFGRLVINDHANQSDAAAIGAIPRVLKLMSTTQKTASIMAIVTSFRHLVSNHYGNKSVAAAAGAILQLLTIMKSRDSRLQFNAFQALKQLTAMHLPNQLELVKLSDSLKNFFSFVHDQEVSELPLLLDKLRKTYKSPGKSCLNGLSEFEAWCGRQDLQGAVSARPVSDEFQTVSTNATHQTQGSCYAFAAVRSFNRR